MFRAILVSLASAVLAATASAAAPRPNIIFVLTDDLGWGDLGVFYQNSRNFAVNRNLPAFATPKLDTMAAQGARLNQHYCPAPVCAPSRASLLLGVHQGHSNVRDNQFDKELANNHTLGTVLKQAGYATAAIGKWGLAGEGMLAHPQNRGFDYFFGYMNHGAAHYHYPKEQGRVFYENSTDVAASLDKCYSTDLITGRSKKWISDQRNANPNQPFFLYLCFTAPHAQLNVPTGPYPAGGGLTGGIQWTGVPGEMINTASGTIDSWIHPDYAAATYDHDNNPGTAEVVWPAYAKRHATMVRRVDDAMGDLLQLLVDLGIDDRTLVVFSSDNGPHNEAGANGSYTQDPRFFRSYGPLDGIKRDVWEGGIRMPTLVRWPGAVPAGRVSARPSQFHDWMNTFADLAGVPAPLRSDGVSLVPDLTGAGTQRPGVVYVEYTGEGTTSTPNYADFQPSHITTRGHMQALFLNGYKGVRYNTTSATTAFRVYDVAGDPREATNLAGQPGVPTQTELTTRIAQLRRAGGGTTRVYDSVPVPAAIPTTETPATILTTDFSGRTLGGTTASGFGWTSGLGEQNNATTSLAFTGNATGFISGYSLASGALNPPGQPIPVAGNIETGGPWSTSFRFTPAANHDLATVDVVCYAISASGAHQVGAKSIRWDVTLQGGALNQSAFAAGSDPGGNGALTLAVGFPGVTLAAGTTYTITLTASSPAPSGGNNLALNSITLSAPGAGPEIPESMVAGLRYRAYEGAFPWVPDFSGLAPSASGVAAGPDVTVRTRDQDVGLAFEGFLSVPAEGSYTFYLTTDTGAFVRLHDLQLIDADFGYTGGSERSSGAIPLKAGLHPIRIHYRHADAASHALALQWQGPGLAKQPIPADRFLIPEPVAPSPPAAVPDQTSAVSGQPTQILVLANDTPGTGPGPLAVTAVSQPGHGGVIIAPGSTAVIYTSNPNYAGTDSFTYTISDGLDSASATVTVEVLPGTSTIWLPFDESSGPTAHDALGSPLGTLTGFAIPGWVAGKWTGALRFFGDGDADSVVLAGNKGVTGTAARTVTFWLKADADQGGIRPTLVSWGADNSATPGIRFDINLDNTHGYQLRGEFNASGVNFATASRSDLRDAGWVHCAIVMPQDATTSQIVGYLDGEPATTTIEPAGSGGIAINTSAGNNLTIGNWATDTNRPFRGILDDLRIYPRALTSAEIAALAGQTADGNFRALWSYRYGGSDMPSESDWASDVDRDGIPAFLEFALGGNPTLPSQGITPRLDVATGGFAFVFNRRQEGIAAAAYIPEYSETLEFWEALAATPVVVAHPDLAGFDLVSVALPDTDSPCGFVRLRVTP